jgi:hypothetical protein
MPQVGGGGEGADLPGFTCRTPPLPLGATWQKSRPNNSKWTDKNCRWNFIFEKKPKRGNFKRWTLCQKQLNIISIWLFHEINTEVWFVWPNAEIKKEIIFDNFFLSGQHFFRLKAGFTSPGLDNLAPYPSQSSCTPPHPPPPPPSYMPCKFRL